MSNTTDNNPDIEQPITKPKLYGSHKLETYNWVSGVPQAPSMYNDLVEVQFKNTRKGYYQNSLKLELTKGDIVAVESSPGYDVGEITLTGPLVVMQMKKNGVKKEQEIKRVYRKARENDLQKWEEAKSLEQNTMLRSRRIAEELNLNMKIGDVEYQGDGAKAIFYYIADERVDFRQLIKRLAEVFRVRIEMKQIGARQEAGRIGGIGPCGRQLCCSAWMSSFVSVSTSAARYQDISLNPQKLAGQCAKLKCCINYEVDAYVEGAKKMPSKEIVLETLDSQYYHFKTDIFKAEITYSTSKDFPANLVTIPVSRVFEIIGMNRKGRKPELLDERKVEVDERSEFTNVVGQDSLTRFDGGKSSRNKNKKRKKPSGTQAQSGDSQQKQSGDSQQKQDAKKSQNPNKKSQNRPNQPKGEGAEQSQQRRDRVDGEAPRRKNNNRRPKGETTDRQDRGERQQQQQQRNTERKPRGERPERKQRPDAEGRGEQSGEVKQRPRPETPQKDSPKQAE